MYNKLFSLLCMLFAIQFTAFAHPMDNDKDTQEVADIKSPKEQSIIQDAPSVQEFKKDIVSHLIASLRDEEDDETGVLSAQLSSAEVDLPCLPSDAVRVHVLRSNFRLPERLFHAPKRCSEEEK